MQVAGLPPGPKSLAPAQAKDKIKKLSLFASFKDKAAIPKLKAQPPVSHAPMAIIRTCICFYRCRRFLESALPCLGHVIHPLC